MIFVLMPVSGFAAPASVSDFKAFQAALENPDVTEINFSGNIYMEKNKNITISPKKTALTINGNGYQLVQAESQSSSYAIQFDSSKSAVKEINVINVNITGTNKKGLIYIPNSSAYKDFAVNFFNVNYNGPELINARYSTVNIAYSTITVQPGSNDTTGYVAEGMNINLAGNVTINKQVASCCRTLFYVSHKGTLAIVDRANVNINNNDMDAKVSKKSGFAYFASCTSSLYFGNYSTFNYSGVSAFTYGCDIGEVYIGEYAKVNVLLKGDLYSCSGMLGIKNGMWVDKSAELNLIAANNTKAYPVVEFKNKAALIINNPKEILIYNAAAKAESHGLAIHNPCIMVLSYNYVNAIDYWVKNTTPYNALRNPDYNFSNAGGSQFSATLGMSAGKVKTISTTGYNGATPFTSANLKDVNVVRISSITYIDT